MKRNERKKERKKEKNAYVAFTILQKKWCYFTLYNPDIKKRKKARKKERKEDKRVKRKKDRPKETEADRRKGKKNSLNTYVEIVLDRLLLGDGGRSGVKTRTCGLPNKHAQLCHVKLTSCSFHIISLNLNQRVGMTNCHTPDVGPVQSQAAWGSDNARTRRRWPVQIGTVGNRARAAHSLFPDLIQRAQKKKYLNIFVKNFKKIIVDLIMQDFEGIIPHVLKDTKVNYDPSRGITIKEICVDIFIYIR